MTSEGSRCLPGHMRNLLVGTRHLSGHWGGLCSYGTESASCSHGLATGKKTRVMALCWFLPVQTHRRYQAHAHELVQKQVQPVGSKGNNQTARRAQTTASLVHGSQNTPFTSIIQDLTTCKVTAWGRVYFSALKKKRRKVLLIGLSENGNRGRSFQVNVLSCPATLRQRRLLKLNVPHKG